MAKNGQDTRKLPDEIADTEPRVADLIPILTDQQIDLIRPYGKEFDVPGGEIVYERGQRNVDFFVVLSGIVEVAELDCGGNWHIFHTHRHGSFLGEMNLFNSRKSLVATRATEATRLLRVSRLDFRRLLSAESELGKIILRAAVLRRSAFIRLGLSGTTLIGDPAGPKTLRIRRFLMANDYPFRMIASDARNEQGRLIVDELGLSSSDLPAVSDTKKRLFKNPCLTVLAYELGLLEEPVNGQIYDLVIVGAGPSGLAASVYAGSEGLDALAIDSWAPGGQAGTTSRIENYLGFPNGISGWELAGRAQTQAEKFGVQVAIPRTVRNIERSSDGTFKIFMGDKTFVPARSVVVASGASYRKLDLPNFDRYEGRGVHFAATAMEAQLCSGQEVAIVGGGNSAGQAAIFLSQSVAKVHMLVRGKTLSDSMSKYLVERIQSSPKIQLYYETEIVRLSGDPTLKELEWRKSSDEQIWRKPIRTLFVMIGALPNTQWLKSCIKLDNKGFVITGRSSDSPYETSVPGVFAIGDVRSGSIKRIASAVGEGSVVISWVHQYLRRLADVQNRKNAA